MKKRLIGLMLAGAMLTGVGTMVGCKSNEQVEQTGIGKWVYSTLNAKNMIVAVYKKKVELHRADIYTLHTYTGEYHEYYVNDKIDYKCSKQDEFTRMYCAYTSMPSQDEYDVLCEECFPNTKLS